MSLSNRLEKVGLGVSRYAIMVFLLLFGAMKFTAAEARAIEPMLVHHPLLGILPALFGLQGASNAIGVVELSAAVLIGLRRFRPRLSGIGSMLAAGTFALTTSLMFTTPGAFAPESYLGGFLLKDLILMAASLTAAAEALRAAETGARVGKRVEQPATAA